MREVAVIGVGMQKWGELWEKSTRDIFVEPALMAEDVYEDLCRVRDRTNSLGRVISLQKPEIRDSTNVVQVWTG